MPNRKSKSGMTREQFAATEFKAIPEYVGLNTNEERKECHEEGLDVVSVVSRISIHLLGPEKRELVANIKKWQPRTALNRQAKMVRFFVRGREQTAALLTLIESAECRFAV